MLVSPLYCCLELFKVLDKIRPNISTYGGIEFSSVLLFFIHVTVMFRALVLAMIVSALEPCFGIGLPASSRPLWLLRVCNPALRGRWRHPVPLSMPSFIL